jgi:hypothetical protein
MDNMESMADQFAEQVDCLQAELDNLKAAFAPVLDWYDGDGECKDFPKMLRLAVEDLQRDRAELMAIGKLDACVKGQPYDVDASGGYQPQANGQVDLSTVKAPRGDTAIVPPKPKPPEIELLREDQDPRKRKPII